MFYIGVPVNNNLFHDFNPNRIFHLKELKLFIAYASSRIIYYHFTQDRAFSSETAI